MAKQVERKAETPAAQAPTDDLMAFEAAAAQPVRVKKPNIDFPFKLTVEHAPLDFKGMFAAAEAFDFYEVHGIAGENFGKARRELCIDIVEVTPTSTTVHFTPAKPMSYAAIAEEMDSMVTGIAKHMFPGGKAKGMRVQWLVPNTGIPSDLRGRLAVVH
jgi:hypothetical protein